MATSHVDRARAKIILAEAGLDALILLQPEAVRWACGIGGGPPTLFRRAGGSVALIPADEALPLGAVVPDLQATIVRGVSGIADTRAHPCWIDTDKARPFDDDTPLTAVLGAAIANTPRPATFDPRLALGQLADQLAERGLTRARLGVDFGFVPVADLALLKEALPSATLLDGTDARRRLAMIKNAREIAFLRTGLECSEIGLAAALASIRDGSTRAEIAASFSAAARAEGIRRGHPGMGVMEYIATGPEPWGEQAPVAPGTIIKFDTGCLIEGYCSDFARTYAWKRAPRAARELHAALLAGLEAGLSALRPGVPLKHIHAVMTDTVRRAGVVGYSRGHFGHSIGADVFSEEWPFIAADCDVQAEPGMVLSVEAPLYVDGLGGFNVEDQVLVTETGYDNMNRSARDVFVIGA